MKKIFENIRLITAPNPSPMTQKGTNTYILGNQEGLCIIDPGPDNEQHYEQIKNIINKETLEYFPPGAIITNSARGDMIDDDAMVKALKSGKIFSLGLDVYNGEPNIYPEYLTLSNVFVAGQLIEKKSETDIKLSSDL